MRRVIPFLRRALYRGAPPSILGRRRQRRGVERGIRIRFLPVGFRACRRRANASLGRWSLVDARMRSGVVNQRWSIRELGQLRRTLVLPALGCALISRGVDLDCIGSRATALGRTRAAITTRTPRASPWTRTRTRSHVRRMGASPTSASTGGTVRAGGRKTRTTTAPSRMTGRAATRYTEWMGVRRWMDLDAGR